jgi:hypothetical protein
MAGASKRETYTFTLKPEEVKDLLIKSGIDIPKDAELGLSMNNHNIQISWSVTIPVELPIKRKI